LCPQRTQRSTMSPGRPCHFGHATAFYFVDSSRRIRTDSAISNRRNFARFFMFWADPDCRVGQGTKVPDSGDEWEVRAASRQPSRRSQTAAQAAEVGFSDRRIRTDSAISNRRNFAEFRSFLAGPNYRVGQLLTGLGWGDAWELRAASRQPSGRS
jgi:hypothetical protein